MFSTVRFIMGVLAVAVACLFIAAPSFAQCTGQCGDVNNSGGSNTADIELLANWLHLNQPPPGDLNCGSVDGLQGITERDIMYYWGYIIGGSPLFCDPQGPAYTPAPNEHFAILHTSVFPAGVSTVTMNIGLWTDTLLEGFRGMSAPLEIRVGGEIPEVSNLVFSADVYAEWVDNWQNNEMVKGCVNPTGLPEGQVLIGMEQVGGPQLSPGRHGIAHVDLTLTPSGVDRQITVGFCDVPAGNVAAIGFFAGYALNVEPCTLDIAVGGDANNDGVVTSADIIYLVNFVFKGGSPPLPNWLSGDANCDDVVTSGDVIYLVGFIFKGGAPPCDACAP